MVMELADHKRLGLAGPSLWDNIKRCVENNQNIKIYQSVGAFNDDGSERFSRPLKGGEATLRWVFLQVCLSPSYLTFCFT